MKIKLSKKARRISIALVFAAAVVVGLFLENFRDNRFIVETISDVDKQTDVAENAETGETGNQTEVPIENIVIDGKININTADLETLMKLDGIGEKTAQKIIDFRNENNGFKSIEELELVNGIGEKKMEALRDQICVE